MTWLCHFLVHNRKRAHVCVCTDYSSSKKIASYLVVKILGLCEPRVCERVWYFILLPCKTYVYSARSKTHLDFLFSFSIRLEVAVGIWIVRNLCGALGLACIWKLTCFFLCYYSFNGDYDENETLAFGMHEKKWIFLLLNSYQNVALRTLSIEQYEWLFRCTYARYLWLSFVLVWGERDCILFNFKHTYNKI